MTKFSTIDGGRDRVFQELRDHPERYPTEEFLSLCDRFRHRMSLDELFELNIRRSRNMRRKSLDRKLLLAILEGRHDEAERLTAILKRRNALGLRVTG